MMHARTLLRQGALLLAALICLQLAVAQAPDASDRSDERQQMVDLHIANPRDGRPPVRDAKVLAAMRKVPRHRFVPRELQPSAYADSPLPIGEGQTISQPYIVAVMTELLDLDADDKVLEIGTGSGYQAAVLAELTPHVWSIEIVPKLAEIGRRNLTASGYHSVKVRQGDGYQGWKEHAPFDAIIVTCAPENVPQPLWEQLRPGGKIIIPIGEDGAVQELVEIKKTEDGRRVSRSLMPVRFVPMTKPETVPRGRGSAGGSDFAIPGQP